MCSPKRSQPETYAKGVESRTLRERRAAKVAIVCEVHKLLTVATVCGAN